MNTKASNVAPGGTSASDLIKYVLAFVVAAAGVVGFYYLPWPAPVRALLVAAGFAAALVPGATLDALVFIATRCVARQVGLEPTTCGFGDRCSAS